MDGPIRVEKEETSSLATLMGFDCVRIEVERQKNLESLAKRGAHNFNKKVKRMLFDEVDNMVWKNGGSEISR